MQVPGPKSLPIIGTVYSIDTSQIVQSNQKLGRKYGEIFRHEVPGTPPKYIVSSHRLVEELFDEERFVKQIHPAISNVRPFAGNGLFTAETHDPEWEKGHRILMPAFSPIALKGMVEGMSDIAEQLLLKWTRTPHTEQIDITEDFTRLTLDTIALCSFSYRFNSFYSEGMHPFVNAMVGGLHESGRRTYALNLQKKFMLYSQMKFDKYIAAMHDTVDELIADRKRGTDPNHSRDILDIMLSAKDPVTGEKLSDENVRFQLVNFLIAGHETTSGMLGFTMYLLLKNPHIMDKARAVVDEVLQGRFPTYEDLPQLAYLDQIFRETLRLYPTAPAVAVTPKESTTIGGADKIEVNPGDTLLILIPLLHRDPKIWEDPEAFDPDRFEFERAKDIPVSAWKPFGNGQRSCIGRAFSLQESTIVLALLLQHLDFEFADPSYQLKIKETLTVKPEDFRVRVKPRPGHEFRGRGFTNTESTDGIDTGEVCSATPSASPSDGTRRRLKVFVGSNAGTCRSFGQRIANKATAEGFDAAVFDLDDAVEELPGYDELAVIVTASYEGLPPDNARHFVEWISESATSQDLSQIKFAVLGSGNSQWANSYHRIPKLIQSRLKELGATEICDRGEVDVITDFESAFESWSHSFWSAVAKEHGVEISTSDHAPTVHLKEIEHTRFSELNSSPDQPFVTAIVTSNRMLAPAADETFSEKREILLQLPAGMQYRTGDYLEVLPRNSEAKVSRFLARFGSTGDERFELSGDVPWIPQDTNLSARELLGGYFDLNRPVTRKDLEVLAAACPCPPEAAEIRELATPDKYATDVLTKRTSVFDMLQQYRSIQLSLGEAIELLAPMQPRRYSIASFPEHPAEDGTQTVRLVYSVQAGQSWSGTGDFEGLCTSFLSKAEVGAGVSVRVVEGPEHFRLPDDDRPVVMISAGSGIAPFKGFVEELEKRHQTNGTHLRQPHRFYYGCRQADVDELYSAELQQAEEDGLITRRTAYSRATAGKGHYVQDLLTQDSHELVELLDKGATVLVCGAADGLGHSVRRTFRDIFQREYGLSEEQAEDKLSSMQTRDFTYVADLFD